MECQQTSAQQLSAVDQKLKAEERCQDALDALFQILLHNLMAGRIRVNHLDLAELQAAEAG